MGLCYVARHFLQHGTCLKRRGLSGTWKQIHLTLLALPDDPLMGILTTIAHETRRHHPRTLTLYAPVITPRVLRTAWTAVTALARMDPS